jgi:hypothetical protein
MQKEVMYEQFKDHGSKTSAEEIRILKEELDPTGVFLKKE